LTDIYYRQEVMRDMEDPKLMAAIKAFAEKMSTVRQYLGMVEKFEFHYHKNGWFLEAALVYCSAVTGLERDLRLANLQSHGLSQFLTSMTRYIHRPGTNRCRPRQTRSKMAWQMSGIVW
jgi:DNA mismatch repair protein MutS